MSLSIEDQQAVLEHYLPFAHAQLASEAFREHHVQGALHRAMTVGLQYEGAMFDKGAQELSVDEDEEIQDWLVYRSARMWVVDGRPDPKTLTVLEELSKHDH